MPNPVIHKLQRSDLTNVNKTQKTQSQKVFARFQQYKKVIHKSPAEGKAPILLNYYYYGFANMVRRVKGNDIDV